MKPWTTVKAECFYCHKKEKLEASSWKVGVIAFREKGWKYDKPKGWICPECAKAKR